MMERMFFFGFPVDVMMVVVRKVWLLLLLVLELVVMMKITKRTCAYPSV